MIIPIEQAADELRRLIRGCNGDTIAALYEFAFGNVTSAYTIDGENMEVEMDCMGCWDCWDCWGCKDCGGCTDCKDCRGCTNCKDCKDCSDLVGKTGWVNNKPKE